VAEESLSWLWHFYQDNKDAITPLLAPSANLLGSLATLAVGTFIARAALKQARIGSDQAEIARNQAATAQSQAETARLRHFEQTESDRRRRYTETFTAAVDQLASDKLQIRLGGIHALKRLSEESLVDHWSVMEMLAAFVREQTPCIKPDDAEAEANTVARLYAEKRAPADGQPGDVLAALTVLAHRRQEALEYERQHKLRLNLSRCDLRDQDFSGAQFDRANFARSVLDGANFRNASLSEASFEYASLVRAKFQKATLDRGYLPNADMQHANLFGASLIGAVLGDTNLDDAHLVHADLSNADMWGTRLQRAKMMHCKLRHAETSHVHMQGADLESADLEEADLRGARLNDANLSFSRLMKAKFNVADFSGANLDKADLTDSDLGHAKLSEAKNITADQLAAAKGNDYTILPDKLKAPEHWVRYKELAGMANVGPEGGGPPGPSQL
jgi:uncharacterized protein YjbI with pentapeptide repeats